MKITNKNFENVVVPLTFFAVTALCGNKKITNIFSEVSPLHSATTALTVLVANKAFKENEHRKKTLPLFWAAFSCFAFYPLIRKEITHSHKIALGRLFAIQSILLGVFPHIQKNVCVVEGSEKSSSEGSADKESPQRKVNKGGLEISKIAQKENLSD